MAALLFYLPEYARALGGFVWEAMNELARSRNELLRMMPTVKGDEMPKAQNTLPTGEVVESERMEFRAEINFDPQEVVNGETGDLMASIDRAADHIADVEIRHLISYQQRLTDATGRKFDAGGRKLSRALILEMLEGDAIEFDEDGEPEIPHAMKHAFRGPKDPCDCAAEEKRTGWVLANGRGEVVKVIQFPTPPTEEEVRGFADLMARKREEFNARRHHRKLS
jgi:hypothetical protein